MNITLPSGLDLHVKVDGIAHRLAPTLVLAHGLGCDLRVWDDVVPLLPDHWRIIRYDLRGHGGSATPPPPYAMGQLIGDAEALCDALAVRDAVFAGIELGGMVAQGLAVKRLDILRGIILCGSATRIGHRADWDRRIAGIGSDGMAAEADMIARRWFRPADPRSTEWRDRLATTSPAGYAGAASAMAGSDFYTTTAALRLPALGLVGSDDRHVPADMVRETMDLIPGSQFQVIRRAGHLAPLDQPQDFAATLTGFLRAIGHD